MTHTLEPLRCAPAASGEMTAAPSGPVGGQEHFTKETWLRLGLERRT